MITEKDVRLTVILWTAIVVITLTASLLYDHLKPQDSVLPVPLIELGPDPKASINLGPTNRISFEGHMYRLFTAETYTWEYAQEYCKSLDGHLATFSTQKELDFLTELADNKWAWVGLSRKLPTHNWECVDGTNHHAGFKLLKSPKPYETHLLLTPDYEWGCIADEGGNRRYFICEWDECLPDYELDSALTLN